MGWFSRIFTNADAAADATLLVNSSLIDVRSRGEFARGHIDSALNLPLDELVQTITTLLPDKETPLLLYCQSGMRSGHACTLIRQLGYTRVSNGGGIGGLALKLGRPIRHLI